MNSNNYIFGDVRDMYFRDGSFDEIVSQSSLEHIDMENSIYGYGKKIRTHVKSYDYVKMVIEIARIIKHGGSLLITIPFGKYENHSFFPQFDEEMLKKMMEAFTGLGTIKTNFFKYEKTGWRFAEIQELAAVESYNPNTGIMKSDDGAAHRRGVSCLEFVKESI